MNSNRPYAFLIASYPRSGNYWVRSFLAAYLGGDFDLESRFIQHNQQHDKPLVEFDYFPERKPFILDGREVYMIKTHAKFFPLALNVEPVGVIHLVRHPLDVFVSGINYLSKRNRRALFQGGETRSFDDMVADGTLKSHLDQFIEHQGFVNFQQHMGSWTEHTRYWKSQQHSPLLTIRYEDLKQDANREFGRIVRFLGVEFDPARADSINARLVEEQKKDTRKVVWRRQSNYLEGIIEPEQAERFQTYFGDAIRQLGYAA